jgi:hypothetical protein
MAQILVRIHPQNPKTGHFKAVFTWRGVKFTVENGWYRLPYNTEGQKQFVEELKAFRQDDNDENTQLVFDVATPEEAAEEVKKRTGVATPPASKETPGALKGAIRDIKSEAAAKEKEGEEEDDGEGAEGPKPPTTGRGRGRGRTQESSE